MFGATPRLRERIDLRTALLVVVIALGAFGLQLAFLAGTVAAPLGGAIAGLDRADQVKRAQEQAVARADVPGDPSPDQVRGRRQPPERRPPVVVGADGRPLPPGCVVSR